MASVSGSVQLRPVRVALALTPSTQALRRAVQLATSAWGGMYYPLISTDDLDAARDLARITGSDVIVPVDAGDGTAQALANQPGFHWKAGGEWGPFEPPTPHLSNRVLRPEANLRRAGAARTRPVWQAEDPLAALYGTWFGEYRDSEYENGLRDAFAAEAVSVTLAPDADVPALGDWVSPLTLTGLDVEYSGFYSETGIVVLDPDNPRDLIELWNLRALGNHVFPWPIGHEARFRGACAGWLRAAEKADLLRKAVRGGDRKEIELLSVWMPPGGGTSFPDALDAMAHDHGLVLSHGVDAFDLPAHSRHTHPLVTSYTRRFSLTLPDDEYDIAVPLPSAPFTTPGNLDVPTRIVAAQVGISRETGLGPDHAFALPNARKLSPLLDPFVGYPELFSRPAAEGRVTGVSCSAEEFYIRAVPTHSVIDTMLKGSNWTTSRSPNGRFATQLIRLLDGPHSGAGNQPAVRWVLDTAARSPHGKTIAALISSARRAQGAWPNSIFNKEQSTREYPAQVVRYLLARKILRPVLPVECPECATTAYLAPEGLATDYSCDMCGKANPLGYILSLTQDATWHYTTASTLTAGQIAETMPIMAAVNVLHAFFPHAAGGDIPYVLGLQVNEKKAWNCELDIALLADDRGAPTVIIGEVKSYRDPISEADLVNLAKVQQYFRSEGFECVILAATLRERIEGEELLALRRACEQSPEHSVDRFAGHRPVLPLILTAKELSAPEHTEHHPTRWGVYDLLERAEHSCRRNLGLAHMDYLGQTAGSSWKLSWNEAPESA